MYDSTGRINKLDNNEKQPNKEISNVVNILLQTLSK